MQEQQAEAIHAFIEASKERGASDEFLILLLGKQGWPQDDVYAALGAYWEKTTGLKIPAHRSGGESSRDAFLYLLSFATLATWAGALGSMLFRLIERWFPDPVAATYLYNARQAMTWQMASLAVSFPIFLIVMRTILREAQERPEQLQSAVRKWLTYVALLLTAGAMISDLIWFLDYFLTGELTTRFILKALTVMLICGAIFVYYLSSLRWDRQTDFNFAKKYSALFGACASVAVLGVLCLGLAVAGTPSQQRQLEADRRRVEDLRRIAMAVNSWYQRHRSNPAGIALPRSLAELGQQGFPGTRTADPQTGATYEYRLRLGTSYEVCANFSAQETEPQPMYATRFWQHGKGRNCFTLDASQPVSW